MSDDNLLPVINSIQPTSHTKLLLPTRAVIATQNESSQAPRLIHGNIFPWPTHCYSFTIRNANVDTIQALGAISSS
jgi:hypothetical protein